MRHAESVAATWTASLTGGPEAEEQAREWSARVDPRAYVGSVHHTVPRFMLQRWALDDQVRTYSRVARVFSMRNVRDLGVRDFYTFIDLDGSPDSSFESLLSEVEGQASDVIARLLSPFTPAPEINTTDVGWLVALTAFQAVRTTRRRREAELQAEWYVKTMASGHISDSELRELAIVPHQNQLIESLFTSAEKLVPVIACRPLALVVLDRPLLLIGDEPLVVNGGDEADAHHADCFLSEAQLRARRARDGKKKRRNGAVDRVVHLRSTAPMGLGVAAELLLPVSPRSALWWGPLGSSPFTGAVEIDRLNGEQASEFAELLNRATASRALDWVVGAPRDDSFLERDFPDQEPLLVVCDGDNAASAALNRVPDRIRPHRLSRPVDRAR